MDFTGYAAQPQQFSVPVSEKSEETQTKRQGARFVAHPAGLDERR
jgi:hypothetical protein